MHRKSFKKVSLCSLLALAALGIAGCVTPGEGPQPNRISTEQEIEFGNQMAAEIEKEDKALANPAIQKYISDMGQRLAKQAARQDVPYAFTVIDNPEVVNAFAIPGGRMYIYTGLMRMCENEAQLASVMAHEIAHVAAHHHGETITRQMNAELIQSILLGNSNSELIRIGAQIAGASRASWFSRAQEREADKLGMDYLFRAGYKPEAMVDFMQKLAQYEGSQGGAQPGVMKLFASHPATTERIANLNTLMQQYPIDLRNANQNYFDRYKANILDKLK
ncbi:MAG TPA: M48 family metallopeptidase [Candidatus Hydrogenedentes bacterium]|nr:M48 family metallopeptidase [Candidatus Hydrogenedentota bacterium]